MKIALLGFGTVGSGVYEILQKDNFKYDITVEKILIKANRQITSPIMTREFYNILTDSNIDTIVEVMGGINPAFEYIEAALKSGKNVVTSNKAVVAKHLKYFTELAEKNKVKFLYEASVGGGVHWIESIKKVKAIDEISSISGIFNGTTNFILYNMNKFGYEFDEILKKAQELGYAEKDPTDDIDGIDILRKLIISSKLAFNHIFSEDDIPVFGIRNIKKSDVDYFNSISLTVKLIAKTVSKDNRIVGVIEPVLFDSSALEGNIPENFNIGTIVGESVGELKFYGQGAGKLPTGNAVVQDLINIINKNKDPMKYCNKSYVIDYSLICNKYYLRVDEKYFNEEINKIIDKKVGNNIYITKEIPVNTINGLFKKYNVQDAFFARFN